MKPKLTTTEFRRFVRRGATDFSGVDLSDVDWCRLHFTRVPTERLRHSRWSWLTFGQRPEQRAAAIALRHKVANQIELEGAWDQADWGYEDGAIPEPSCGTAACVCGWTARFVAPGRIVTTRKLINLSFRVLWADGLPMPSFDARAKRDDLLAALRAE
jgi:hypothetical protein